MLYQWQSLRRSFHVAPVDAHHFAAVVDLVARPTIRLRSGDALHLAIAIDGGFGMATLDRDLAAAAAAMSVETIDPLST